MKLFLSLLGLAAYLALLLAAYAMLPPEAFAAWPVYGLDLMPVVVSLVVSLAWRASVPLVDAPFPDSAAAWLQRQLERLNRVGTRVAALARGEGDQGSFYHPASRTIVLGENVHDEHTPRAYATAAHELGHALFHTDRPRLSALMLFARAHAFSCFSMGVSLLLGAALVGGALTRAAALLSFAAAVVLHALVMVDETMASAHAEEILGHGLSPEHVRVARSHLRRALTTYGMLLLALVTPLATAPWLLAHIGDGLLVPGAPLTGAGATAATIGALLAVAGAAAPLCWLLGWRSDRLGTVCIIVFAVAFAAAPLPFVLLLDQPGVPPWAVTLATIPAWLWLSMPLHNVVGWVGKLLGRDLDERALPYLSSSRQRIERVTISDLMLRDKGIGWPTIIRIYALSLWMVPLSIWWLLA